MPVLSDGTVVKVKAPTNVTAFVVVKPPPVQHLKVVQGARGPAGPAGDGAAVGVEIVQSTPAATWILTVPDAIGRRPSVAIFVAGQQVIADVTADSHTVSVQFPNPTAGSAVLT